MNAKQYQQINTQLIKSIINDHKFDIEFTIATMVYLISRDVLEIYNQLCAYKKPELRKLDYLIRTSPSWLTLDYLCYLTQYVSNKNELISYAVYPDNYPASVDYPMIFFTMLNVLIENHHFREVKSSAYSPELSNQDFLKIVSIRFPERF